MNSLRFRDRPGRGLGAGGAGYIGSHTCLELLLAGHEVVVVDNLANSSEQSLARVQELAGRPLQFHRAEGPRVSQNAIAAWRMARYIGIASERSCR